MECVRSSAAIQLYLGDYCCRGRGRSYSSGLKEQLSARGTYILGNNLSSFFDNPTRKKANQNSIKDINAAKMPNLAMLMTPKTPINQSETQPPKKHRYQDRNDSIGTKEKQASVVYRNLTRTPTSPATQTTNTHLSTTRVSSPTDR